MHYNYFLLRSAGVALIGLLTIFACSSNEASKTGSAVNNAPPITIIREIVNDDPQKSIDAVRMVIGRCESARKVMGTSEGDASGITDEQILQLTAKRIEERFSGDRYAEDTRYSVIDYDSWGPEQGKSCAPRTIKHRTLKIITGKCGKDVFIAYDLETGSGTREEIDLKRICGVDQSREPDASGEVVQLGQGGKSCRWNVPEGAAVARVCLLEPSEYYPGTNKELVVKSDFNRKMIPPSKVTDINVLAQGMSQIERLISLDVGTPIAEMYFEIPADSKNFPVTAVE